MKWRLFLTYIVILVPNSGLLYLAWWYAADIDARLFIESLRFIPYIAAAFFTLIIWAIWNFELRRTEQSKARSAKTTSQDNSSLEKRKRERLDSVLRDLSDEDLLRLRQRLNDGTINEDALEEGLIGEDGELLYQEKRR
jgi:hypothetical protein